uniref:Reverse transcriptase Ty1/copia-type domain-containing protein n=1 Tax=Fagus sylvatica TaxID=28930 RepID=A0A2N9HY75_FAGSY
MNETNLNQGLGCVVFLAMVFSQKGFRCYDPISRRLRISRHVEFWEHQTFSSRQHFPFISSSMTPIFTDPSIDLYPDPVRDSAPPPSSSDVPSLVLSPAAGSPDSDPAPSAPSESPTDIRRSTRVRAPPSHLSDYHCYFALATLHEPHTYREASTNPLWQQAMADELDALHKTHTWDMTTLPPSKSAVGCKWVYKIKTRADGSVERYKARLVARGFTQEYGIDYEETFAPVARLTSVRSLLAVAAVRHWPLFQMDVKNAFLNGDLLEEVYMQPPPGYPDSQNQVCRLRRALYGLKQAPRAWFAKFSSVVMTLQAFRDLQKFLSQQFEMKDLGTLSYFLGLEVTSSSDGYYLSQAKYASDLLSKAGLTDSKTVSTPLELNVKLNTTDGEPLSDATLYRQLVGSLIYLTVTRSGPCLCCSSGDTLSWSPLLGTVFPLSCAPMLMQTGLEIPLIVALPQVTASYWVPLLSLGVARNSLLLLVPVLKLSTVLSPMPPQNSSGFAGSWLTWVLPRPPVLLFTAIIVVLFTLPIMMFFMSAPSTLRSIVTSFVIIFSKSALHLLSVSSEDQLADVFTKSHPPGRLRDLVSKLKMASSSPPCV